MSDVLLEELFKAERWEKALFKANDKGINLADIHALSRPEVRLRLYRAIRDGNYEITPPHTAKIPKDNGDFRTVYINENTDRIFLSIVNDILFDLMPNAIHPTCVSYQKGIGCGKIVKDVSRNIADTHGKEIGWKSDLSKYFDSVPIEFIDREFDKIEYYLGKSKVVDVLRKYYHCDLCFDTDGNLVEHYQSLKQGCSVASYLADSLLYELDDALSKLDGYYVRYSDDMLFIGNDYKKAMRMLQIHLAKMKMSLNPKKVEYLTDTKWFKFLGYSIKGNKISLSSTRIKKFQGEIDKRTIKSGKSFSKCVQMVLDFLYVGNGEYSWATQCLTTINVKSDIDLLNGYVMDALRAVYTNQKKLGGLGYQVSQKEGCIQRGKGRNVKANMNKLPVINGYYGLWCMRNNIMYSRQVYNAIVRRL